MFRNLEAEIARTGMKKSEIAKKIGITPSTLSLKISGKSNLSLIEAYKIKNILKVDISIEELFNRDN